MPNQTFRRGFLQRLASLAGLSALARDPLAAQSSASGAASSSAPELPRYARAQNYKSLKQSSYDRTGGNADRYQIAAGGTQEVFAADGPGIITHIWFTIGSGNRDLLKQIVLRIFWDGNSKPSVETPIGDFFGLNLAQFVNYESEFLSCSPIRALNSYFAMPFRRSARITVTNESSAEIGAFYSNIDYQFVSALPGDVMYFHAQYRQKAPNAAMKSFGGLNLDGASNYVFVETHGRGHLMGVTLGVLQNSDGWFGEGDDMIFIDDETKPAINGTGTEDYFNGAWDFGGIDGAVPFSFRHNGAPIITNAERTGGRYCLYRWHSDNPVTFTKYLKHTIEHGTANDRADNFYSVAYWYQSEPYTDFPALPSVGDRIVRLQIS
jgi:Protein of unknown function (DUF2961)